MLPSNVHNQFITDKSVSQKLFHDLSSFQNLRKKQYNVQEIHLLFSLPDVDETINFTLICFLCMKLQFDLLSTCPKAMAFLKKGTLVRFRGGSGWMFVIR